MTVRRTIPEKDGIYFITFTCYKWLHLFEISNGYAAVYNWFDVLKSHGHYILSYVIMPNHVHTLVGFSNTQGVPINTIVGNGKRFIGYEIIENLKAFKHDETLIELKKGVNRKEVNKGKLHQVFEPSFDWKACDSDKFVEQKINYIHNNPCSGKWSLAEYPWDYLHSSAEFYSNGTHSIYEVLHYQQLEDIDLTKPIT